MDSLRSGYSCPATIGTAVTGDGHGSLRYRWRNALGGCCRGPGGEPRRCCSIGMVDWPFPLVKLIRGSGVSGPTAASIDPAARRWHQCRESGSRAQPALRSTTAVDPGGQPVQGVSARTFVRCPSPRPRPWAPTAWTWSAWLPRPSSPCLGSGDQAGIQGWIASCMSTIPGTCPGSPQGG